MIRTGFQKVGGHRFDVVRLDRGEALDLRAALRASPPGRQRPARVRWQCPLSPPRQLVPSPRDPLHDPAHRGSRARPAAGDAVNNSADHGLDKSILSGPLNLSMRSTTNLSTALAGGTVPDRRDRPRRDAAVRDRGSPRDPESRCPARRGGRRRNELTVEPSVQSQGGHDAGVVGGPPRLDSLDGSVPDDVGLPGAHGPVQEDQVDAGAQLGLRVGQR